ncbi:MAG TPA: hypothetical protein PK413_12275 [Thermoanaerobaculia bacterium]|nr:hypothetical protein [Thermoanaerobaculia bacterium]
MPNPEPTPADNREFRLDELLDTLGRQIDRAGDRLSLKSYARGTTYWPSRLELELQVQARVAADGTVLFRIAEPGAPGGTALRLDLSQRVREQLEEGRRPLEGDCGNWPLSVLAGIEPEEIAALESLSIFTTDDLERAGASAPLLAELARHSRIPEPRLRTWLGWPYLLRIDPATGERDLFVITGAKLMPAGEEPPKVFFAAEAAEVVKFEAERLVVRPPASAQGGPVHAEIDGICTNALPWQRPAPPPELRLEALGLGWVPPDPVAREAFEVNARVRNPGKVAVGPVDFAWYFDRTPPIRGTLPPIALGQELLARQATILLAGTHKVRFVLDPDGTLPIGDRSRLEATAEIPVRDQPLPQLVLAKRLDGGAPGVVKPGEVVPFVLSVSHAGPVAVRSCPLEDSFDSGFFVLESVEPAVSSQRTEDTRTVLRWENLGPLAPNTVRKVTLHLKARPRSREAATDNLATVARATDDLGRELATVTDQVRITVRPT